MTSDYRLSREPDGWMVEGPSTMTFHTDLGLALLEYARLELASVYLTEAIEVHFDVEELTSTSTSEAETEVITGGKND